MENFLTREHFQAAADYVRAHTRHQPRVGLVLGSGLGDLADAVEDAEPFVDDQRVQLGAGPARQELAERDRAEQPGPRADQPAG